MYHILFSVLAMLPVCAGSWEMTFEEDLRFGAVEGADEYAWSDARAACLFDVDERGHFFVADQRASSLYEFDANGVFVRKIGGKGKGPGEFDTVACLSVLPDGGAVAINMEEINLTRQVYAPGVRFKEAHALLGNRGVVLSGSFTPTLGWVKMIAIAGGQPILRIAVLDHQFALKKIVAEKPYSDMDPQNMNDPNAWATYLANEFRTFFELSSKGIGFLQDGRVVIADGTSGRYEIYSADMSKKIQTIEAGPDPISFTEKEQGELVESVSTLLFQKMDPALRSIVTDNVVARAIEMANLPEKTTQIFGVVGMDGGRFGSVGWVNYATGEVVLSVLDEKKGRLGKVKLPDPGIYTIYGCRLTFKNGYAYAMVTNEEQENQIVRYSLY